MELEGTKVPLVTRKASRTWSVALVCLFGCFEPLLGLFWAKNGCFWPKTAQIWEGTYRLGAPAPGRQG